jgi:hypothetical protein
MRLVGASVSAASTVLGGRAQVPLRVRPGERPVFVDLPEAAADGWLAGAYDARVGLDCWVALSIELRLLERALAPAGPQIVVALDDVCASATVNMLAPSEALRLWQQQLVRSVEPVWPTSVALPERVVVRARGELAVPGSLEAGKRALRWEHTAAGHGETMETWALRCALTVATTS